MMQILMIIQVIVSVLLVFVILIQNKSVSLNLASMWGGMDAVVKRWPEKVLHNATIVLGTCFIVSSVILFLYS